MLSTSHSWSHREVNCDSAFDGFRWPLNMATAHSTAVAAVAAVSYATGTGQGSEFCCGTSDRRGIGRRERDRRKRFGSEARDREVREEDKESRQSLAAVGEVAGACERRVCVRARQSERVPFELRVLVNSSLLSRVSLCSIPTHSLHSAHLSTLSLSSPLASSACAHMSREIAGKISVSAVHVYMSQAAARFGSESERDGGVCCESSPRGAWREGEGEERRGVRRGERVREGELFRRDWERRAGFLPNSPRISEKEFPTLLRD